MQKKIWFPVGILVALIVSLACSAAVAPLHIGVLNLAVPLIGLALGGAVAGYSLDCGYRGTLGFAIAFTVSLPFALPVMIGIQGMSGNEGFVRLLQSFCGTGAIVFGILAAIGTAISGLGWRTVTLSSIVFAAGGMVGGIVLAIVLSALQSDNRPMNQVLLPTGIGAFFLVPAVLGGAVLDRQLPLNRRLRETKSA